MTKLDGKTPDLAAENIEQLRQIFPDVFEDGKIDFNKPKQVLGKYVDDEEEYHNFTWNGKGKILDLAYQLLPLLCGQGWSRRPTSAGR